ncbi:hypothetical protein K7432_002405 [Basidiobolus ranarum]|uniref:RING-type domain-containing protein n=1 Tax=Basidiobolus ranarum TaxID=34480 RepID=A0ABR2X1K1_9FUNG
MFSIITNLLEHLSDYLFDINFDEMELEIPPWLCSPAKVNTPASEAKQDLPVVHCNGDEICTICLEKLTDPEHHNYVVRAMPCGHMFHQKCIFSWLDLVNACPLCRSELKQESK